MSQSYDLDVATPEKVPAILEAIANHYRESAGELSRLGRMAMPERCGVISPRYLTARPNRAAR